MTSPISAPPIPVTLISTLDADYSKPHKTPVQVPRAAFRAAQAARNLFIGHAERLESAKALVRDRGSQFVAGFDEIFRTEGMKILKTPVRVPVANTFAERWIGSIRRELLDRTIIWNQQQLERLVRDYVDHHNQHRPHQSLEQRPPTPVDDPPEPQPATVTVLRTSRCDGLINEYENAA